MPLDDFDFILGNDFFQRAKVALLPHLNGLQIMDEKQPCFVAGINKLPKRPLGEKIMSGLQLEKGLRKGEHTYVAALIDSKPDKHVEVQDVVVPMLKIFEDVRPPELPKKLPPRRQMDHQIELVLRLRPPTQAPYWMTPPKLIELRKQLTKLVDVGLVQLSKEQYGGTGAVSKEARRIASDVCGLSSIEQSHD